MHSTTVSTVVKKNESTKKFKIQYKNINTCITSHSTLVIVIGNNHVFNFGVQRHREENYIIIIIMVSTCIIVNLTVFEWRLNNK